MSVSPTSASGCLITWKIVEMQHARTVYDAKHPYTEALMSAPRPTHPARQRIRSPRVGSANASGCYFHPRCTYVKDICKTEEPTFDEISPGHFVKCHRAAELNLSGVMNLA